MAYILANRDGFPILRLMRDYLERETHLRFDLSDDRKSTTYLGLNDGGDRTSLLFLY